MGSFDGPSTIVSVGIPLCVITAALFTAIEQSITALGEARARSVAEVDGPYRRTAERLLSDEVRIRARLLAGRILCLCLSSVFATLWALQFGAKWAIVTAILVSLLYGVIVEFISVVTRKVAGRVALPLLRYTRIFELLMIPIAAPLAILGTLLDRIIPTVKDDDAERVADLEVESVIEKGEESGAIDSSQAELLRGVLEFKDTLVREIMVPRTQMIAIEVDTPLPEIVALIKRSGHSRYPVYRERADKVLGILYAKDFFRAVDFARAENDNIDIQRLLRKPVFFIVESQKIGGVLKEMQQKRVHLAVVVDEFGGTSGIVTLEDILEEIVGEIQDEHDSEESRIAEVSPGRFLVDASLSIYDLEDALGVELPEDDGSYDSVGGLVVEKAGRVPAQGESVVVGEIEVIVRESDRRRVRRVEVIRREPGPQAEA